MIISSSLIFLVITLLFISYLIGSFTFGYFAVKFFHGVDLRKVGSKNVGATNTWRSGYKLLGFLTFLFDALKAVLAGYLAIFMIHIFDLHFSIEQTSFLKTYLPISCAALAVLGHLYSIFLGFKGGKGVSTFFGFLLFGFSNLLIYSAVLWLFVFSWKRTVSLASLSVMGLGIFYSIFFTEDNFLKFIITLLSVLIIIAHRENIKNLIKKDPKEFMNKIDKK